MRAALEQWAEEDAEAEPPVGHWAVRRREDDVLLGSITLRRMPPFQQDLELAWQVRLFPLVRALLGRHGDRHRAAPCLKAHLDATAAAAAAPVIEKYTGVLAAADVFTESTTFWVMESIRLDLGYGSQVQP